MAGQSLKIIANSGQLVNFVTDSNISKLFGLYEQEDNQPQIRQAVVDSLLLIAKNIGLRKIFLKRSYLNPIMKSCLEIIGKQDHPNFQFSNISFASIKVLVTVCTVRANKFYIPGETNIAERLRKKALDTGTFILLRHVHSKLKND
jgi:hypothetical protein